jgi:hypothetical protein
MEDIYDLTDFNLKREPELTFIVKKQNNETVILCNDNIIGTYNGFCSEHDITDIIDQMLYEKNIGIEKTCFVMGMGDFISVKTDNKSYDNNNRHTVVKDFKTISLYFSFSHNKECVLKCFIINYKLYDMAHYIMIDMISAKYSHIVSPKYDEEADIEDDSINVTLYFDLSNCRKFEILNKLKEVKETFIKNIKFTSNNNKYIISCKLFQINNNYYRLYVCMIYNIELDKSVNVCVFNHMNKFIYSNETIRIKENDKYINILDNKIFIDLEEYKMDIYKSYINYNIED